MTDKKEQKKQANINIRLEKRIPLGKGGKPGALYYKQERLKRLRELFGSNFKNSA